MINCLLNKSTSDDYIFGATFAGPFLYNYVSYVLEDLVKKNASNLYFVARDGYLLKEIADNIINTFNYNIKTKYIYGSREAWKIPGNTNYNDYIEDIFKEHRNAISKALLSKLLKINISEFLDFSKLILESDFLDKDEEYNVKNQLLHNQNIKNAVIDAYKEKRELLYNYLHSELAADKDIYFVDVQGSGTTIKFLSSLISVVSNNTRVHSYYYTTYTTQNIVNQFSNFFFNVFDINSQSFGGWAELLCRANHGQTMGYKLENNKIEPILADFKLDNYELWNFNDYRKGVIDFSKNMSEFLKKNEVQFFKNLNYQRAFFDALFYDDDNFLCDIYGNIPFNAFGAENKIEPSCPEIKYDCLIKFILNKTRKLDTLYSPISINRSHFIRKKIFLFLRYFNTLSDFIYSVKNRNENLYLIVLGVSFKLSSKVIRILSRHNIIKNEKF